MRPILNAPVGRRNEYVCFCSDRMLWQFIGFHRLIMGKVEFEKIFCLNGNIKSLFYININRVVLSFVQIAEIATTLNAFSES